MTSFDESALNDTLETAPVMPRTQRAIDAEKVRELRNSTTYKKLRADFRAEGARQRNPDGSIGAPCWLCNGDVDYRLEYPHPWSWSADHAITVKENPSLLMDKNNLRHSHHTCNQARGTDDPIIDLGIPSEVF